MLFYICAVCQNDLKVYPSAVEGELILKCEICARALEEMTEEMDYYKEQYEKDRSNNYNY